MPPRHSITNDYMRSSISLFNEKDTEDASQPERHLGLFSGVALIIGLIIGSGIFASPGPLLVETGSIGAALLVWFVSGVLSAVGAFCYAELGTLIPSSGGEFQYLSSAYGPLLGLTFSWANIMMSSPIATASIAIVFARYAGTLGYYHPNEGAGVIEEVPTWLVRVVALVAIWVVVVLNMLSRRSGSVVQNFFSSAKVLAILVIIIVGLVWIGKGHVEVFKKPFEETSENPLAYGTAMYLALFAYNGWNNLNYVTGELKNPQRNLPLAITISVILVFLCYELANIAYFAVLPLDVVRTSNTVAMQLGVRTMGAFGGYFMCIMVCCSTFGAMNASIWATSRILVAAAEQDILFPKFLAGIHPKRQTPIAALVFIGVITSLWTLPGDFTYLANIYSFLVWVFYLITVVGLLVLRRKMPDAERPFRIWWPLAVVFALVAAYLVVAPLINGAGGVWQYVGCLVGCALVVPIWWFRLRRPKALPRLWQKLVRRGRSQETMAEKT